MTDVVQLLADRGKRYGKFTGHAEVTQALKAVVREQLFKRQKALTDDQQESLDMIFHKIGRIINGDENYDDSWVDIAGYAKLVADRLQGQERRTPNSSASPQASPQSSSLSATSST